MLFRIFFLLSVVHLAGCARVVSDNFYPVTIDSSPSGADFIIKNQAGLEVGRGITPKQVTLKTHVGYFDAETYAVSFNKPGYKPDPFVLDTTLDEWYYGNFLIGGVLGLLIVDPLTGAMWELPEKFSVELEKN